MDALKECAAPRSAIQQLLMQAVELEASDLHLVTGDRPTCRVHGRLRPIAEQPLQEPQMREMLQGICPPEIFERFCSDKDVDFSFELGDQRSRHRFRANFFVNQGHMGACVRLIPAAIPEFEWAGFPLGLAERLAHFRNGLVLVTGVAGSGKSTTLAMIINLLTREGGYRVITVEEPVEYLFPSDCGSIVSQREVGLDVRSFSDGLKYGLRQDPDIILVGEIRDRETARMALSAAETGHLVFSTMHTRDAKGAITRYADLFPQTAQQDVRTQLALSLRAVVSQHLLPARDPDSRRRLALEVLINNLPVASAIRTGKVESIDNCILTGKADGMITLDESLRRLMQSAQIAPETAARFASETRALV